MRLFSRLSSKIVLLAALPLVVQLSLLGFVAHLQDEAEAEAERAQKCRQISDEVLELIRDVYAVRTHLGVPDTIDPSIGSKYIKVSESIDGHFNSLRNLTKGNAQMTAKLNELIVVLKSERKTFLKARRSFMSRPKDDPQLAIDRFKAMNEISRKLSDDLVALGDMGRQMADESPEKQRAYRAEMRSILIYGGIGNLLLSLLLAVLLSRNIVSRLKIINDNSYRLASDKELNEPLSGDDEIAGLDAIFHQMARDITNASSREKAILETAYDCICSLDLDLKFISSNPSCQNIFGLTEEELISTHLSEYLSEEDKKLALAFRDKAKSGASLKPLQLTITTGHGETKQVLWSARVAQLDSNNAKGRKAELFSIFHDISEIKKAQQLRQEVVAMVTHDLRAPLMTVQSFLDMLEQGYYQDRSDKLPLHRLGAERSTNRMMQLIGDLLDIEKMETGMMQPKVQRLAAKDLLEKAITESQGIAGENDVTIKLRPTTSYVMADEDMVLRVLNNLIFNALKYSPKGGCITLHARNSGQTVTFSVADEGPGIDKDMLKKVFEKFQQAPDKSGRNLKGSGLGLTICKAIVKLHGGDIWVESEGTDGTGNISGAEKNSENTPGSQFYFQLPKAD